MKFFSLNEYFLPWNIINLKILLWNSIYFLMPYKEHVDAVYAGLCCTQSVLDVLLCEQRRCIEVQQLEHKTVWGLCTPTLLSSTPFDDCRLMFRPHLSTHQHASGIQPFTLTSAHVRAKHETQRNGRCSNLKPGLSPVFQFPNLL